METTLNVLDDPRKSKIKIAPKDFRISKQIGNLSPQDVAVISQVIAKDATAAELMYFLNVCKTMGLNPFNKEVWCYKDHKGNLVIFAGRDGMLAKAQQSPLYNGIRSSEVRAKDDFVMDIPKGEIIHRITHKTSTDRGAITCGYSIVFRKDGEPTIEIADFNTYNRSPSKWGKTTQNVWDTHPEAMIKKVAETAALKKAFGISGIQSAYDWDLTGPRAIPINVDKISESYVSLLESKLQSSTLPQWQKDKLLDDIRSLEYKYEAESIQEILDGAQPESDQQYMDRKTDPIEKSTGGVIRRKGETGIYDKYHNFTDPDIMAIRLGWPANEFKEKLKPFWQNFEARKDSSDKIKGTETQIWKQGDILKIKYNG